VAVNVGKVWNVINVNFRDAGTRLVKSTQFVCCMLCRHQQFKTYGDDADFWLISNSIQWKTNRKDFVLLNMRGKVSMS